MVNKMTQKSNRDNRSRQKNPNNDQYYKDRGYQGGKIRIQEKVWNVKLNLTKPEMTKNKN